jgi:hypothetical protein
MVQREFGGRAYVDHGVETVVDQSVKRGKSDGHGAV